eukprot:s452_g2.t1
MSCVLCAYSFANDLQGIRYKTRLQLGGWKLQDLHATTGHATTGSAETGRELRGSNLTFSFPESKIYPRIHLLHRFLMDTSEEHAISSLGVTEGQTSHGGLQ